MLQAPLFHRAELLLGATAMDCIQSASVILFGVGGVGSWTAEALIRTGLGRLTIVDSDVICPTNVNRQAQATARNVGMSKVDELRKRLLEINPDAEVTAVKALFSEETRAQFDLGAYDYVLDAIDSLRHKVLLLRLCFENNHKVFASMGAAAKLDPAQVRCGPLGKTTHCPLARVVRHELRVQGVAGDCLCVYSAEPPAQNKGETFCGSAVCACPDKDELNLCAAKAKINGSLVHVTAPFGFALAGLVIQDLSQ